MRWSDDKLKSNYHRVRMPTPGEDQGSRYSIAYFNQVRFSGRPWQIEGAIVLRLVVTNCQTNCQNVLHVLHTLV
jgi:hypothetical protein